MHDVLYTGKGTKVFCQSDNQIQTYDWATSELSKPIYQLPAGDENNVVRMTIKKDEKLVVADQNAIVIIDKNKSQKNPVHSKLKTSDLDPADRLPVFRSLTLIEEDNFLIALTARRVHKLSLKNDKKIESSCEAFKVDSDEDANFRQL